MERNDKDLVRECLEGIEQAFEELVNRYQKVVFNVAYRMVNDYDTAEDITQVVFIKSYEKMDSFDPKYRFFSWLYRIAINEALNHINQRKRMTELTADMVSKGKAPDEAYSDTELSRKMGEALMELDPTYRTVVVLKHFRNLSYKEMSDILEIPEKTVKSRLFTGRQLLRKVLVARGIIGNE
ncbi:MAG: sigma-70 family RNA polymerase sigma factor [Candidatus Eisenbacteria bacterium]